MAPRELYFVRHGLAGVRTVGMDDRLRPLTRAGLRRTRAVAIRLREVGLRFDGLLTSPLVRARQTADILHDVGLAPRPEDFPLLAPGGDVQGLLVWLRRRGRKATPRLGLVGHMPGLATWAEALVLGDVRGQVALKKAGILGLSLPAAGSPLGRCSLFLLTSPRFLL